ncbi:leukocyte elastase inhibitor-like isoform X1 [Trichoplusia ni]|uniref:Leukocyte elastase inhibitor-like isoform X1 n=1 Tax=Trichoplusia ni TaxID=7111 RepID=A0A7E5VWM7_TRINI|nr:leukocyte elastase inhibitor-like isoform X1 [Trichoplusia ni]XP_026732688.1 leukocyte elastase inhibitor-like isoform X1 [Trichoplusia ni]
MEVKAWVILTLTALSIHGSCGQEPTETIETTENVEETVTSTTMVTTSKEVDIASTINEFGYKLLVRIMQQRTNDNVVISPSGVVGLIAMALLGSVGKTYNEIAETLGFSQDILKNRRNHEQFGALLQALNTNVSSKTLYADAMFVDEHTPLREIYRKYLNDVYRGDVLNTDFKQSEEARLFINEWVRNHTEGNIEKFLVHPLPTSTKVVLLSALYFKGQWEQPFVPEYTMKIPFNTTKNEVMADLMLNFGHFRYSFSRKHSLHILALPYNDSETTMYALKPRFPKRLSILELMESLDYKEIDEIISGMSKKKCVIRFPKMAMRNSIKLEDTLKAMGMRTMFTPGLANFALMVNSNLVANRTEEEIITDIDQGRIQTKGVSDMINGLPNPGLHIDSIVHDVKMTIDEYGTEAVAATSAILARSAEQFYADSPFYMFIRNERTKLVTFSAVIFDPTVTIA